MNVLPRFVVIFALLLLVTAPGCGASSQQVTDEPAAAAFEQDVVLALLQEGANAWSRGDLDTFVSVYADDCLFMTPSGLTRGRQQVLDRYRERYPDRHAMGTLQLEVVETRSAPPSGVAVAARWVLSYPDRPAQSGHTLVIFRRIDGVWQIVQDASM
jgi:uncharacterized protein (TIGR02246 family)